MRLIGFKRDTIQQAFNEFHLPGKDDLSRSLLHLNSSWRTSNIFRDADSKCILVSSIDPSRDRLAARQPVDI
jgi:hypothetical protein